jgi:predicted RNA-binding protein with PUA-like domain
MNYWLVKSDPDSYSWNDLKNDNITDWDGVRNYQARNNLKNMKNGDLVFIYESVTTKEIKGITEVTREFFQDTTTDDDRWVAVELTFKSELNKPVSLSEIKSVEELQNIALIKQSRLSVMPIEKDEFDKIIEISNR